MTREQATRIVAYIDARFDELRQQKKGLATTHVHHGNAYLPEPIVRWHELMDSATKDGTP